MHLNEVEQEDEFNLSYPNIIINILHAVLYTIVLIRKNYLNHEDLFRLVIIYFIHVTLMFDSGMIMWGKITS